MMRRLATPLLASALLASACAVQADEPPDDVSAKAVPDTTPVSPDVPQAVRIAVPELSRDSLSRRAKRLTVRVRNVGCRGIATGSGFAIASDILVTNRHVLAGADRLEVSTWNGRSFEVESASVGALGDIGVAIVDGRLPQVGEFGRPPKADASVTAVGYPLGGPLTLSRGVVIDRVDGGDLGVPGTVVRLSARIRPGNSGGPLLNASGRVAGVVYAIEVRTGFGLAIPVDTLKQLARVGGFEDVPPCGFE